MCLLGGLSTTSEIGAIVWLSNVMQPPLGASGSKLGLLTSLQVHTGMRVETMNSAGYSLKWTSESSLVASCN